MAVKTPILGLNTWLENDIVDFEEVNENFELIDSFAICTESGTKTAAYNGGSNETATWRYKQYSDGTVEMSTALYFSNLPCSTGSGAPYRSNDVTLYFPFNFSSIYAVHTDMAAPTVGFITNKTDRTILDHMIFNVQSMLDESQAEDIYKQIFITVKGVLA